MGRTVLLFPDHETLVRAHDVLLQLRGNDPPGSFCYGGAVSGNTLTIMPVARQAMLAEELVTRGIAHTQVPVDSAEGLTPQERQWLNSLS